MKYVGFLFMFIALISFSDKVNGQITSHSIQGMITLKNMETILDSFDRASVFKYLQKFNFGVREIGAVTDVYRDTITNREFRIGHYDDKIQNIELWTKNGIEFHNFRSALENGYRPLSSSTYKGVFTSSFYVDHYYFRVLKMPEESGLLYIINLTNAKTPMRRTTH